MSNQMIRYLDEDIQKDPGSYNTYQSVFVLCYNLSPKVIVFVRKGTGDVMQYAS